MGQRIRDARKRAGLTQQQLGDRLQRFGSDGVTKSAVSQWETGETEPSLVQLAAVAQALGESIDWLLLGKSVATLSRDEAVLLTHYRQTDETGRAMIEGAATRAQVTLPPLANGTTQ